VLSRLSVETIVLESFERGTSKRRHRMEALGRAIVAFAAARTMDVAVYSFAEVRSSFATVGATTRHDIAESIARQLPPISHLLPKRRQPWDGEQ
jgi:hypothetical protein